MKNLNMTNLQIKNVIKILSNELSEILLGVYLYGSSIQGGLKENSDIDILVIVSEKLDSKTKENLIKNISPLSRKIGEDNKLRYIEITIVVKDQVINWVYPPRQDFIYGEWLQDDYLSGYIPENEENPDLTIILYQARKYYKTLLGKSQLEKYIPEIPFTDIKKAILSSSNEIVIQHKDDETNVILTLCRMILTLKTGNIYSKDKAGYIQSKYLPLNHKLIILNAINDYLGVKSINWNKYNISETIDYLYNEIVRMD